jgi:hypothetical protein
MASLLGSFADRSGSADAAQRFYTTLDGVGAQQVGELLDRLAETAPTVVRLPSQQPAAR